MYTASSLLCRARKYFIPTHRKSTKTKIFAVGGGKRQKRRYYFGDSKYYREKYLKSTHWYELRNKKLSMVNACEKCKASTHLDVHHLNYRNLYDVELSDLMVLCRKCHTDEHNGVAYREQCEMERKKMLING